MIYELPSFVFFNIEQGKYISKIAKNTGIKFNLIYSYEQLVWQGPSYIKRMFNELQDSKLNCIVECRSNTGFVLSLIRMEIKNLMFFSQNTVLNKKLIKLADQYGSKVFLFKKFKKIHTLSNTNEAAFYVKELDECLKKVGY